MKRYKSWKILLSVFLVLMITSVVMAGTSRSPLKDIWCLATAGAECYNAAGLTVISSSQVACAPSRVAFIGWDLTDVTGTVSTAELTLTTFFVSAAPVPPNTLTFQLFEPSIQDWTEAAGQTSPGNTGAILATTSVALVDSPVGTNPQTVVFGGAANPADADTLGAYFQNLIDNNNGMATVGVRISGGCLLNTAVSFNDRENTGNLPGGAAATEPDLILFTPTAVSLTSVGVASNSTGVATAVLLLAAVLGLATAGVAYTSRAARTRQD